MARYEIRFYSAKSGKTKNYPYVGARRYYTLGGARNKWWEIINYEQSFPEQPLVFYIYDRKTGEVVSHD